MTDPSLRISEYLYGTIDETGVQELSAWIKSDPTNAEEFVREAFVHAQVRATLKGQALLRLWDDVGDRAKPGLAITTAQGRKGTGGGSPQSLGITPSSDRPVLSRPRLLGLAASIAAVVGLTIAWGYTYARNHRIATAVAMLDVKWDGNAIEADKSVPAGLYRLSSGLCRLDFSQGSQVIIEAPCAFAIDREHLRLESGRAVVTCPTTQSRSFVVETGDLRVEDLGTEYGVVTDPNIPSRVAVFQGSVRVTTRVGSGGTGAGVIGGGTAGTGVRETSHVLVAGQSWPRFLNPVTPDRFVREDDLELAERAGSNASDAGWAKHIRSLLSDPSLVFAADMNPIWDGKSTANLADPNASWLRSLNSFAPLRFTSGRLGNDQSLIFSHRGEGLRINVPGQFSALTLAAWVKLDSEPLGSLRHRGLVMSDGWGVPGQVHWQLKRHGIRVSIFGRGDDEDPRYSAYNESLFDGNWHQCASVIETNPAGPSGVVSHYIDGVIVYRRQIPRVLPSLRLGNCTIGNWVPSQDSLGDDRTLGGMVDDLLIWNRALSPTEIEDLHRSDWAKPDQSKQPKGQNNKR